MRKLVAWLHLWVGLVAGTLFAVLGRQSNSAGGLLCLLFACSLYMWESVKGGWAKILLAAGLPVPEPVGAGTHDVVVLRELSGPPLAASVELREQGVDDEIVAAAGGNQPPSPNASTHIAVGNQCRIRIIRLVPPGPAILAQRRSADP